MTPRCLICESVAVLPKENANTAVMLIGAIEGVARGINQPCPPTPESRPEVPHGSRLLQLLELIGNGVSTAISECSALTAFAQDVQKYQFSHYDYLCLRCGARFDESACAEMTNPAIIIPSSAAPPSAPPVLQPSADPHDSTVSTTD